MSQVQRAAMPVLLVCFIALQIAFSSCADKIKTNIIAFEALDEGLINSNFTLDKCSQTYYASLEQKTKELSSSESGKQWLPKAMAVQKLTTDAYNYIEGLKADLKKEAGLKTSGGVESYKETDKTAVMRLFEKKKKGEELFERLKSYKHDILAVDADIEKEFNNTIILTTPAFDAAKEKQDFTKTFLNDIPAAAALALLTKFQNNIKVNENRIAAFCNNHAGSTGWIDSYRTYSMLAVISSSYLKAGDEIEITSGIGGFSKAAMPKISINKKNISPGADGAAHYKFKASDKPGKYIIPVEINFIDEDGKEQTLIKNIEYTVAG